MGLRVDVICTDGSPIGISEESIYGVGRHSGIGGAELALLTVCRGLHDRGHKVTVYNNATNLFGSVFEHRNLDTFRPKEERDVLLVFRSPFDKLRTAKGLKVWWSCDQYTVGDFKELANMVDRIIVISDFHAEHFKKVYGIFNTQVIDIPVRTWEYKNDVKKKKNSCIFTSVPDRGLMELLPIWRSIIAQVPDATLTITSDWSLWTGADVSAHVQPYRMSWAGVPNVNYVGAINRKDLIQIQQEAQFHLFPCTYDELFCISVAESQVAGAIPITSEYGALRTTNRFGYKIGGNPQDSSFKHRFVDGFVGLTKLDAQPDIRYNAEQEFGLDKVLDQWEKVFTNG